MPRKQQEIKLASVGFYYVGEDKDFNLFLKTVVRDYLREDEKSLVTIQKEEVSDT